MILDTTGHIIQDGCLNRLHARSKEKGNHSVVSTLVHRLGAENRWNIRPDDLGPQPCRELDCLVRIARRQPAVAQSVQELRAVGVTVLLTEGGFTPHRPRHGDLDAYPWQAAVDALPA